MVGRKSNLKSNFIGVLPNFGHEEFSLSSKLLFRRVKPKAEAVEKFSKEISTRFDTRADTLLTDSARTALNLLLVGCDFPAGSEVLVSSFTCVVVVNPLLWQELKPIYIDIALDDLNTPLENLLAKITPKTKMILIQHTFGAIFPVKNLADELEKINRQDIILVEDLAHVLPEDSSGEKLKSIGKFSHFSILSFGVEKVISTIRGGALLINRDKATAKIVDKVRNVYSKAPQLPDKAARRLLLNAFFWRYSLPVYHVGVKKFTLGRILTMFARKTGILGIAIEPQEYSGGRPGYLRKEVVYKMPAEFAEIGLKQIRKYKQMLIHRHKIAWEYNNFLKTANLKYSQIHQELAKTLPTAKIDAVANIEHGFLRYPLILDTAAQKDNLIKKLKKNKIVLGDWYDKVLFTKTEYLDQLGYKTGSNPNTEKISSLIVNLPTHVNTSADQTRIILEALREIC